MRYYNNILATKEKEQSEGSILEQDAPLYDLVLFNDDVNTFDWVIETLIEVCEHEVIQAEQCAFVVHYKGKCTVKSGDFDSLEPMQRELSNRNLSAEVL
jgi:ATP-dependent Clp protease adaptor protein ClpS